MRKFYFFVLILSFFIVNNITLYANLSDLKSKQEENKRSRQSTEEKISQNKKEQQDLVLELNNLDIELNQAYNNLYEIEQELGKTEQELEIVIEELDKAIKKREEQEELFKERIAFMYVYGNKGYLEILLNSSNLSDFFARLLYMDNIIKFDQQLVSEMTELEHTIDTNRISVLTKKEEIEKLLIQQEKATQGFEVAKLEKTRVIEKLHADEEGYNQILLSLNEADAEIEALIRAKQLEEAKSSSNTPYNGNGKLAWPLPTNRTITGNYGNRTSPINGKSEFHTGIDIGAPTGTPILAADNGIVIFSGTINGFGLVTIISHENGMTTMYAHSSKLLTSEGQAVSTGETIALVGTTGYVTGPHLHFEVRINGSLVEPRNYL